MRLAAVALAFVLSACGNSYEPPQAEPAPGGTEPGSAGSFAAIAPVVQRSCGRCHNGSVHPLKINSQASFKTQKNLQLIESGRMPPGGGLPAADKTALVGYLRG